MSLSMQEYLIVPLAPLVGAIVAGLFGKVVGRTGAHVVTILGVLVSLIVSVMALMAHSSGEPAFNQNVYTWMTLNGVDLAVGFLVDGLTAMMMVVVTFVSLAVHIYTIGYMRDDPGYQRFFSYISLFTFSMLMLVMSNNFVQLFFGWEAVGVVSYLLIGFWYTRPTAIFANLKAFLINRVGDFGFVLGIGLVYAKTGSLDYATVFRDMPSLAAAQIELIPGQPWPLLAVMGILLFVGAMGKSAQFPLHVWLPDSMEGPTPISALIHAATMVTAGIFMVARMSPIFELSEIALSFILVIGAITALFMGFLGIIQNDIKRVVAYSTLSQLGYMTVALGASAYSVAVFHLMTHAFFKALLFLAAGSVIIGMHHDQDIRNMGGLRKYMPITWITSLLGSLALIGTPFFAGFYSKDSIIEAVKFSNIPGSGFAYVALMIGVFVTAFYSFRMYFLVFHGPERFGKAHASADGHGAAGHDDDHADDHHHGLAPGEKPHESSWVVTLPLIALAIPSVLIGAWAIEPMLFGNFFQGAILVDKAHPAMESLRGIFHGWLPLALHGFITPVFWLAAAGVAAAWYLYLKAPHLPAQLAAKVQPLHRLLDNKYYMDDLYLKGVMPAARGLGSLFWQVGDRLLIDGLLVNGSARLVGVVARLSRSVQSGYVYHYAFMMIVGVLALLTWFYGRPILDTLQALFGQPAA